MYPRKRFGISSKYTKDKIKLVPIITNAIIHEIYFQKLVVLKLLPITDFELVSFINGTNAVGRQRL
jgi:hypothetical protein